MFVALNAKGQGIRGQAALSMAVLRRLLSSPREFVLAPKSAAPTPSGEIA